MINNIVSEVFNFNIYAYYLSTNRATLVVHIAQTVYYCIIVSTLQFNSSIGVTVDDLDRFDTLLFFYFEADNLPSRKFCFLTSSRKLIFVIS